MTPAPKTDRRTLWIVTRKHPPSVGGMEELSFHVACALSRRQPITLVKWGGSQLALAGFLPYAALLLLWGLVRRRVSVLFLGDPMLAVLGALSRRFGVPVMATVHGLDITWPNRLYQAYLRRFFFGRCDAYVCISSHVRDLVRARGVEDAKIAVIPVGIAANSSPEPPTDIDGEPLLLYVGRLVPRKGVAWFVNAVLPGLVGRFPRIAFLVAGAGPEQHAIESAANRAGVASRVRLLGAVPNATKWALLRRCDVVVMPNVPRPGDTEGFGLVALEANIMGKPVAAADLEGLRDAVVPGENGWRFPAADPAAWIDGLTRALGDSDARIALGARAKTFAARLNWDAIGERYAAVAARLASA